MTTSAGPATSTIDWDNDIVGDNDDDEDISGLAPAMYHVIIIDGNGCVKLDSTEVFEGSLIDLTTTVTGFDLMSNQSGAISYQWLNCGDHSIINGATSQTYSAVENGDYEVEITLTATNYEFKIASEGWDIVNIGGDYTLVENEAVRNGLYP